MQLSEREKKLLVLLAAMVVIIGAVFFARALFSNVGVNGSSVVRMEKALKELRLIEEKQQQWQSVLGNAGALSLTARLENIAEGFGLSQRIQLNPISTTTLTGVQGVAMRVDDISIDEMVYIVHAIESDTTFLMIDTLEVAQSLNDATLLRVMLRVHALR